MAASNAGRPMTDGPDARDGGRRKPDDQAEQRLASRLRGRVSSELNAQKDRVTDALDDIASRVRRAGEPLRDDPYAPLGEYAEGAASRIEQLASDLREHDVEELAHEVGEFARRRPGVFVGASLAAGILAARFLKSSGEHDESREHHDGDRNPSMRRDPARVTE